MLGIMHAQGRNTMERVNYFGFVHSPCNSAGASPSLLQKNRPKPEPGAADPNGTLIVAVTRQQYPPSRSQTGEDKTEEKEDGQGGKIRCLGYYIRLP